MNVKVKLFATLRQDAGWAEREVDLDTAATVEALLSKLDHEDNGLTLHGRPLYVAVNAEYAERVRPLQEGDEVALFPPVSGGTESRSHD